MKLQQSSAKSAKKTKTAKKQGVATQVFKEVAVVARDVSHTFSVTVEYGERNIRSLSFAASKGLRQLKEHVKKTCPNWVRIEVELPKGTRTVIRNPKGIKVIG